MSTRGVSSLSPIPFAASGSCRNLRDSSHQSGAISLKISQNYSDNSHHLQGAHYSCMLGLQLIISLNFSVLEIPLGLVSVSVLWLITWYHHEEGFCRQLLFLITNNFCGLSLLLPLLIHFTEAKNN